MERKKTLRQMLEYGAEFYENHANYLNKRAEKATKGSNIQIEIMMNASYRKGMSKAYKEVLELLDEYIG